MAWYEKAWAWLKRNWKWILFPIGILTFLGKLLLSRKTTQVVSSELSGAADFQATVEQEAEVKATEAAKVRDSEVEEVVQKHEQEVQVLTNEQKAKVEELRSDPSALNSYLLDVGKQVRGERK